MMLWDVLRKHEGKRVVVMLNRANPVEISGVVQVNGDEVFLHEERNLVPMGQPVMNPQTGQMMQPRAALPESNSLIGNIDMADIVYLRVFLESIEDAKKELEREQSRLVQNVELQPRLPNIFNPGRGK
jgi:hypothetical protein